jgi:hypothetical protein
MISTTVAFRPDLGCFAGSGGFSSSAAATTRKSFETDQKGGREKNPESQDESDAGQEAQVNRDKGFKSRSEDEDAEGKGS